MTRDDIAQKILLASEDYAEKSGFRFGGGALHEFQMAAERAAVELERAPSADQDGRVNATIATFRVVIDEMIAAASSNRDYMEANPGTIGEQTLRVVKSRLCPIFPFC